MTKQTQNEKNPFGLPGAPEELEISLTGKCNLRCKYCFYADEMAALDDLPAQLCKLLGRTLQKGVCRVG